MTAIEYQMKKQQIARLKFILHRRFLRNEAIELARAIIECEKYEKQQIEANAEKHRKIFE